MLRARIVTAIFLLAGLLGMLVAPPMIAILGFAGVAAVAGWEWAGLMKASPVGRITFSVAVAASCAALWVIGTPGYSVVWGASALFWLLVAPLWLARRWMLAASSGLLAYGIGWLLLVPAWAAMVDLHARSPWLLLATMALAWVADTVAYFTGRAFGRHQLAPSVSPGKTWEGAIGGVLGVLIYAVLLAAATAYLPAGAMWLPAALLVVLLAGVSIVGDLFESLMKRQADVKDSSHLLPGHGGVLDRIDSLVSTLPLVALVLFWMDK